MLKGRRARRARNKMARSRGGGGLGMAAGAGPISAIAKLQLPAPGPSNFPPSHVLHGGASTLNIYSELRLNISEIKFLSCK